MSMLAEDHLNKDTDAASESRTAGAPPKRTRQNDSKRRTVQVEYVAPRSQGDLASRSALHSETRWATEALPQDPLWTNNLQFDPLIKRSTAPTYKIQQSASYLTHGEEKLNPLEGSDVDRAKNTSTEAKALASSAASMSSAVTEALSSSFGNSPRASKKGSLFSQLMSKLDERRLEDPKSIAQIQRPASLPNSAPTSPSLSEVRPPHLETSSESVLPTGKNFPIPPIGASFVDLSSAEAPKVEAKVLNIQQRFDIAGHWSGKGQHVEFQKKETIPLEEGKLLGRGASADVHEVTCRGLVIARKQIYCSRRMRLEDVRRELDILKKLNHKHVVTLVGSYIQGKVLGLLLLPAAVCDLGVFLDEIEEEQKADTSTLGDGLSTVLERLEVQVQEDSLRPALERLQRVYGCLVKAVQYLHDNNIRHKDLKPRNILLDRNDGLFITDFGISRDNTDASTSVTAGMERGTYKYCAPEVARFEPRGRAADIYSLGCVFLEIRTVVSGMSLTEFDEFRAKGDDHSFQNGQEKTKEWIMKIRRKQLDIDRLMRPKDNSRQQIFYMLDLIERMIEGNPADRPLIGAVSTNLELMGRLRNSQGTQSLFGRCCQVNLHSLEECKALERDFVNLQEEYSRIEAQVESLRANLQDKKSEVLARTADCQYTDKLLQAAEAKLSEVTQKETEHLIQLQELAADLKQVVEEYSRGQIAVKTLEFDLKNESEARKKKESEIRDLQDQIKREREKSNLEVMGIVREHKKSKGQLEDLAAELQAEKEQWLKKESDLEALFEQMATFRTKHG